MREAGKRIPRCANKQACLACAACAPSIIAAVTVAVRAARAQKNVFIYWAALPFFLCTSAQRLTLGTPCRVGKIYFPLATNRAKSFALVGVFFIYFDETMTQDCSEESNWFGDGFFPSSNVLQTKVIDGELN